jgi:hypothetical protein
MIWVTWAQHRREALVSGLVLATASTLLVITGLNMLADFERSGVARCVAQGARAVGVFVTGTSCEALTGAFPISWHRLTLPATLALMTLPALLGVFIAAPLLSREFEQGTYLLAWSQSITKLRWAVVKIGLLAASVVVAATALALLVIWWHGPLDVAGFNGPWDAFDIEGLAPIAYATFALALGTLAGLLIRRTVPAMALTLFVFAGVRLLIAQIRPHFLAPVTANAQGIVQGSWVISPDYYVDTQGHQLSPDQVNAVMKGCTVATGGSPVDCLSQHGIRLLADYQPLDRFWTFQLIEAAVFFGLAISLIAVTLWWLQRRL